MHQLPLVTIIGAGLAGSEAAWQAAERGVHVRLIEMRPETCTAAHQTGRCAELVCSNSFRGAQLSNAVGLLKEELAICRSLVMKAALEAQVPAGASLAVDRELFSAAVDKALRSHPRITVECAEVEDIPQASPQAPVIIATGPLTAAALSRAIGSLLGSEYLAFYDAISPIVTADSIDFDTVFAQSRYDKGEGADFLNVPLSKDDYDRFVQAVIDSEKAPIHEGVELVPVEGLKPFEGCMPIEDMAMRGPETLRFGPLKPVGLTDPRTDARPYAALQLRRDNKEGTLWGMVGMQTRMKHGEQQRLFRALPGLEQAEFVRFGTVHRNTFIDSPRCLHSSLEHRERQGLFFAGQLTGTEGYVEAAAGGLVAGINAARCTEQRALLSFPPDTAIGSLLNYISDPSVKDFQPMNISFGLFPAYAKGGHRSESKRMSKKERRIQTARNAMETLQSFMAAQGELRTG